MNIKFTAALLCDHIRQEMSGKYILIGIYSSSIVFGSLPNFAQFQLFARANLHESGDHMIRIRVNVGGIENQRFEAEVNVVEPSEDWLPIPLQPIQFQVPGPLSSEQLGDDGEWSEFLKINVTRPPNA